MHVQGWILWILSTDFCRHLLVLFADRIWFPILIMGQAGVYRSFRVQKLQHVNPNLCIFRLNYEDEPLWSCSGELAWETTNSWNHGEKKNLINKSRFDSASHLYLLSCLLLCTASGQPTWYFLFRNEEARELLEDRGSLLSESTLGNLIFVF